MRRSWRARTGRAGLLVVMLMGGVVAGCASTADDSPFVENYRAEFMWLLPLAEEMGASEEQLRFLRELAEEGRPPSYEEYSDAVHRTLDCARDGGVVIDGPRPGKERNQPALRWGFGGGMTEEEDERRIAVHDGCHLAHSYFIEIAYMAQPAGMEWEQMVVESYREPFLDCLRSYGVTISDDASQDEISNANSDLVATVPNWEGPNCRVESGLNDAINAGSV